MPAQAVAGPRRGPEERRVLVLEGVEGQRGQRGPKGGAARLSRLNGGAAERSGPGGGRRRVGRACSPGALQPLSCQKKSVLAARVLAQLLDFCDLPV